MIGECCVPCTLFVAATIDLFIRSYPAFHFCQVAVKSFTCPTFRRFLYNLLVRNDMVVNEHNKVSNIAQKLKYFRYCWACFRLQYAWNICRWTLKQLIINQIDLWRENGKCSSYIEIKLSPAEFNVRYPIFFIYRRIAAITKSQNCSSLYNSPYFCSGSQKLFAQLTHSFPDFPLAEYSWNTDRWTLSNNQSIN